MKINEIVLNISTYTLSSGWGMIESILLSLRSSSHMTNVVWESVLAVSGMLIVSVELGFSKI